MRFRNRLPSMHVRNRNFAVPSFRQVSACQPFTFRPSCNGIPRYRGGAQELFLFGRIRDESPLPEEQENLDQVITQRGKWFD